MVQSTCFKFGTPLDRYSPMHKSYIDNSERRLQLYQSTVTPKRAEQNLFVRFSRPKSEAEITNNKLIIHTMYCTVKANYR